jgi:hypothetical protein
MVCPNHNASSASNAAFALNVASAANASNAMSNAQSSQQVSQEMPVNSTNSSDIVGATTTILSLTITLAIALTTVAATQFSMIPTMPSCQGFSIPNTSVNHRNYPYGILESYMVGLQANTSTFSDNENATFPPLHGSAQSVTGQNAQPSLTSSSLFALRQPMEESNHDMVNMLTQQVDTVFNPLIQDINNSYQALSIKMERIANFFSAPLVRNTPAPQNQNGRPVEIHVERPNNGILVNLVQQLVAEQPILKEGEIIPILVHKAQNADQVVIQAQQNNLEGRNNIANVVEAIMAQNGFNLGLHRPNFVSPLCHHLGFGILPRGWKTPKFTKFVGEANQLSNLFPVI